VLVLGAWVHPALSATAVNTRCDQSIDSAPISADADHKLAMRVIDHGSTAAEDISLDETSTDLSPNLIEALARSRVETILRRISDEAKLRQPQLSEPAHPETISGPLAVEKSEAVEEPAAMINTDQSDSSAVELPEFSADEFLRYRQQMFRKDI
jgi:hypothetical protein